MKKINLKLVSKIVLIVTFLIGGALISPVNSIAAENNLIAKDFVTWNQGEINGYDVGFVLTGKTFNEASSIVIKLYSGSKLLQTNTAVAGKITGTEFLTPFDVWGSFDYMRDGYFTNKRESEYGQTLKPTRVVAIVTFNDSTILIATNSNLDGKGEVLGVGSFHFKQKMKVGSKGNEVMELQKFLNSNDYDSGTPDGKFGPKTKNAVIQFQLVNKLDGDGIVGPITLSYLNK